MFAFFERLLPTYPPETPQVPSARLWSFLWDMTKGGRIYLLALMTLTASIAAFEAFLFALLGFLVDWLAKTPPDQFWVLARAELSLMAAFLVGSIVLVLLACLVKYQTLFANMPMRLRWMFHRLMLAQSMSFYQNEFSGRVSAKVMQTALAVRDVVITLVDILVFVGVYFITMVSVVGSFDLRLMGPFAIWVLAYVLVLRYFVPRIGLVAKRQADARSLMTGRITDAYTNISTVKLFSHAEREASYAKESMQEFMQTAYPQMRLAGSFETTNHALSVSLVMGTGIAGLWVWTEGGIGSGAVAASVAMAIRLMGISHWVMYEMANLFENIGTVRDGISMLAKPLTIVDAPSAQPLEVKTGRVEFRDVCFSYGPDRPVIHHLNLVIRPGEKVGLVGPSGAGKSTLTNLLLRFYDLDSGVIQIDGQDIAKVTQNSLRAQIGMVTQDTSLLHRSVRDNIVYGRPQANDEEVWEAVRRAHAEAFVPSLEDQEGRRGLDAHVGERGVKLSGGQRQRVAIARVILKDAPILLLDEATSALDSEVEAAIQQSLAELMQGKTVLAIAHRLSTIAALDRLIVLDEGRIVEEGSHTELLQRGGLYARLWAHQSGGFLALDARS
jgi:ATP-binding cassette subfamily B multidrug efflux pump